MTIQTTVATSQSKTFRHCDNVAVVAAFAEQTVSQARNSSNPGVTHSQTKLTGSVYAEQQRNLCITHTVEHKYNVLNSTVRKQLHVSALYVGHLQVEI